MEFSTKCRKISLFAGTLKKVGSNSWKVVKFLKAGLPSLKELKLLYTVNEAARKTKIHLGGWDEQR
jgi:hypothetical protein